MKTSSWLVTPDKFLRPEQVSRLLATLRNQASSGDRYAIRNVAIVETLLGTGLRVSELCALSVADLFLDAGASNVLVRRGKGGKARLVAIPEGLARSLSNFLTWKRSRGEPASADSAVFMSERGGRLCRSAVHRLWKRALAAAELPTRWGVHGTRHSYAVEVYRKTRDLRLTQRQLGHSSPITTTVYANLLDNDVRRGVERLWTST